MKLNLPEYSFKIKSNSNGRDEIYDELRKKFLVLTPEEWVRQNFIKYLMEEKKYPSTVIAVEKGIKVNNMQRRFDTVIFNRNGKPLVLVEFKSPKVAINQKVMDQISRYNQVLNVDYMIISNGLVHYCCRINNESGKVSFMDRIPSFEELLMN